MRSQNIRFTNQQAICVFPNELSDLKQAITELRLEDNYPVIVLIGGQVEKEHEIANLHAIETISKIAEDMNIVVISG